MTREQCKEDVKRWQKDSATGGEFFSVDKLIDKLFSTFEVKEALLEAQLKAKESDLEHQDMIIECLNIDLDNKEKLLKAKDDEIRGLNNLYADTIKDLGDALMEIERLKGGK